jgi:transposase
MSTDVPTPNHFSRPLQVSASPGSGFRVLPNDEPHSATDQLSVIPASQPGDPGRPTAATPSPIPAASTAASTPLAAGDSLPDDPVILKRMILELLATLAETRHEKQHLQERIHLLLHRLYGRRSERYDPNQPLLFPDINEAAESAPPADATETAAEQQPKQKKRHNHGRKPLPKNFVHQEEHYRLTAAELACPTCGSTRIEVGSETTSQLDYQPASVFVRDHIEHKYACPCCSKQGQAQFVAASKPAQPLGKGSPGAGLLSHIIVAKYFDHLPLYRQEPMFERQGLELSRSTACDWMASCARCLEPLYQEMKRALLKSAALWTDDTPVKLQGGDPDATKQSRLWGYLGDIRHPYNVFDFTPNHKRDGPQKFLKPYSGYLHADAFSGYDALYLPVDDAGQARIIECACNAHARRKFYDARDSDAARAHRALAYYRQLYEIERQAKEQSEEVRQCMRQELAVPIFEQFHSWLLEQDKEILPKSTMKEAFTYALNQRQALRRYTEAGFLTIDNNAAEREMKQIAIGRKNWLQFGSPQGGKTAAILYSFTSTCRRLGVEPWAYLKDVLTRLPTTPKEQLPELLPDRWQAAKTPAAN